MFELRTKGCVAGTGFAQLDSMKRVETHPHSKSKAKFAFNWQPFVFHPVTYPPSKTAHEQVDTSPLAGQIIS